MVANQTLIEQGSLPKRSPLAGLVLLATRRKIMEKLGQTAGDVVNSELVGR